MMIMVDVTSKPLNPLAVKRERLKEQGLTRPTHVRVFAKNEDIRRSMRHGVTRVRFLPELDQSVEWPYDQFTKRRLEKGDVTVDTSIPGGAEVAEALALRKQRKPFRSADAGTDAGTVEGGQSEGERQTARNLEKPPQPQPKPFAPSAD
jgi:hypothetical protein